jgi:predicted O-methyltransferase YrrM
MLRACLTILLAVPLVTAQDDRRPPGGDRPMPRNPLFLALDADRDGTLSAEEIAAAPQALATLDRDGDGQIAIAEMRPPDLSGAGPRGERPAPQDRPARSLEKPPLAADEAEQRALEVLAELDENRRGNMNVPEEDGRLLRLLAESIGARKIVELGTSNGYSGIWFGLALRGTGGHLFTHEIDPERAKRATTNFERAGVDGYVTIVLGDAHEKVTELEGPIDLVFLDADKQGYIDYLQKLLPLVRPGGLICAHNMSGPSADPRFVEAITTDPRLDTLFLHMGGAGMSVSLKKTGAPEAARREDVRSR